jgi:hypothetical protein
MEAHPPISDAFKSGKLSEAQAKEIASAADVCPDQAADLVEAAEHMDLPALKRHCSDTRSVRDSETEEVDLHEQIRSRRYCRIWSDPDGTGRVDARLTPDALAVLLACLDPFDKQVFNEARKAGRHERRQVYRADALISMAKASVSGTAAGSTGSGSTGSGSTAEQRTLVRIRVDLPALKRGHRIPGETCEIPGISSIPVKIVREILGDSLLELVLTQGQDVRTVCSDSRYIRKALRIALEERDQTCVVPECNMSDPLEVDHWITDYSKDGPTRLDNLARICSYHHHQKTYRGWRLEGGPGRWRFVRPDPPPELEHPEYPDDPDHKQRRESSAPATGTARRAKTSRAGSTDGRSGSTNRRGGTKRATGPPEQDRLL